MMFKRFLKSNFFKRSVIIITLTAVFTAVFSIFIVGLSANEVVYLSKVISSSDFAALSFSNLNIKYSYQTLSDDPFLSIFGDTSNVNYRISSSNLPYNSQTFISNNSFYGQGVVYTNNSTTLKKSFAMSFNPNFDLYFDDFDLEFYTLLPDFYLYYSFQYLDSDSNLINISYDTSVIATSTLSSLYQNYSDLISSDYYNYILSNPYYTHFNGVTTYVPTLITEGSTFRLTKFILHFTNLDKTKIDSIIFNFNFNHELSNYAGPRFFPYVVFTSFINAFIKSDQDQVYSEQLALQREISQKLSNIDNTISGEMPSEAAQELESQAQQQAQLQGDIKVVENKISDFENDLEWNRTYPEVDQENVQPVYSTAVTTFFSFLYDPTELIPRLIAFGSSMLILFTVFKRF